MEYHRLGAWGRWVLSALMLVVIGCSGSGGSVIETVMQVDEPQALQEDSLPESSLPQLPDDLELPTLPRLVATENNYQYGKEAGWRSTTGATIVNNTLKLASSEGSFAWGVWRWGEFTAGVVPISLQFDMQVHDSGEYWMLLSDYDGGRWDIHGPITPGVYIHNYVSAASYLSPSNYTYVAILVEGGNALDVYTINLVADADINPPAAPRNLSHYPPFPTSVRLRWTANSESDLYRYSIYSGPEYDFDIYGDGVTQHGQAAGFEIEYSVSGLIPENTYYFRITALDLAGNESAPSNTTEVHTPPDIPLPRPYNLSVDGFGSSWADLSWQVDWSSSLLGYECYTGPFPDFSLDDDGVVKRNNGLITGPTYRVTDLLAETEYHVAVLAYYTTGKSPLSDSQTLTTLGSVPPVPDFTYSPAFVEAGVSVEFDPSGTTDFDTPLSELLFKWDYTNDGNIDKTTTGPEVVTHGFPTRGTFTTKLAVTDGTYVYVSKEITVNMHYEYFEAAQGTGAEGSVAAVDTDPSSGKIALLVERGDGAVVEYFNGSLWTEADASILDADYYCDVALDVFRFSVLTVGIAGTDITWKIHAYDGASWTEKASGQLTADEFAAVRLDISPAGRTAIAVMAGSVTGADTDYTLYVWHEKADSSFASDTTPVITNIVLPHDVQRDDSTSRFIYCISGQVREWAFTDSGDTDTSQQSLTGTPQYLATGQDPADGSHVFWAVATTLDINYGDNYGSTSTIDQYFPPANTPTGLVGVGLAGDNEVRCCWTEALPSDSDNQRLMNHDSTANGGAGASYEITADYGLAATGQGAYYTGASTSGIYAVCDETRDGECVGYYVANGAALSTATIYSPQDTGNITDKHCSVHLTDGSFISLSGQEFATCRASTGSFPVEVLVYRDYGMDNWVFPDTASTARYAWEFISGSYSDGGDLVLYKHSTSFHTGQQIGAFSGTSLGQLAYNPFSEETMLFYATDAATDLAVRQWHEGYWSDPMLIMSGDQAISTLAVSGNMEGDWGVAYIDSNDSVWLVESQDGAWDGAEELSSAAVNAGAGIGFDYHTNGSSCVAVERDGGGPGIYMGAIPAGSSIAWEQVSATAGSSTSIYAFYHLDSPIVLYYEPDPVPADGRMQLVEKLNGSWTTTGIPGQLHGAPVAASRNVLGNIVLTGYRVDGDLQSQAVGILYR